MAYNLTNMTTATSALDTFVIANNLLSDLPAILFLLGVWALIVLGVALNTGELLKGIVGASFISTLLSFMFYGMDLVSFKIPLASMALLIISVLVLWLGGIQDS